MAVQSLGIMNLGNLKKIADVKYFKCIDFVIRKKEYTSWHNIDLKYLYISDKYKDKI